MYDNNFLISFIILEIMISLYLCILAIQNKIECWTNSYSSKSKYSTVFTTKGYHKILPNLYLGNIESAENKKFIKEKKIKVIINCTTSIPNYFQFDKDFSDLEYFRIPVDDSLLDEDIELMAQSLSQYVKIINNALLQNKPVLVHCYAGRQRSACLIAAYLIYKYDYSIDQAYKYIISKRKEAFHYGKSYNFHKSLLNYIQQIKK
jgi:protein tyrosine/serine phosphatase